MANLRQIYKALFNSGFICSNSKKCLLKVKRCRGIDKKIKIDIKLKLLLFITDKHGRKIMYGKISIVCVLNGQNCRHFKKQNLEN